LLQPLRHFLTPLGESLGAEARREHRNRGGRMVSTGQNARRITFSATLPMMAWARSLSEKKNAQHVERGRRGDVASYVSYLLSPSSRSHRRASVAPRCAAL
jgi:hypothetical protein